VNQIAIFYVHPFLGDWRIVDPGSHQRAEVIKTEFSIRLSLKAGMKPFDG
jgi:hypothetical protein